MRRIAEFLKSFACHIAVPESEYSDASSDVVDFTKDSFPVRPSVPLVLIFALSLWGSGALILWGSFTWSQQQCLLVGVVGALLVVFSLGLFWCNKATFIAAALLGVCTGLMILGFYTYSLHGVMNEVPLESELMKYEVIEDGSQGLYGSSCIARTTLSNGQEILVQIQFEDNETLLHYGQLFITQGVLESPSESSASYLWCQGVVAQVSIGDYELIERSDFLGRLIEVRDTALLMLSGFRSGSEIIAALVCGWREDISDSQYDDFKAAGLAHIIAVSGAHLSIVSTCMLSAVKRVPVSRSIAHGIVIACLLCYLVLAAAPPSAIRAAVMAAASLMSFSAKRRSAASSALAVCMVACIALSPAIVLSTSFALSALSTLGITVFFVFAKAWFKAFFPRLPRFVGEALCLTWSASVLTLPLSCALFSQVSLIAPLSNVFITPLFAPLCTGGMLAVLAGIVIPSTAPFLLEIACFSAHLMGECIECLARIPYACIPTNVSLLEAFVLTLGVAAAIWLVWPKPQTKFVKIVMITLFCLVCVGIIRDSLRAPEIIMLDIGQGDAFLIRSRNSAVLVDTGTQDKMLFEALARHGVYHLDAVIITHGDDDHMGSLEALCQVVNVEAVLLAQDTWICGCDSCDKLLQSATSAVGEDMVSPLEVGDSVNVGQFTLHVLWPQEFLDEGGNSDSICLLAEVDIDDDEVSDWCTLFTGDAESDQLDYFVESGTVFDIDILKVGHHGSNDSLSQSNMDILQPEIALVSAGEDNSYGHPHAETISILEQGGATVFCTADSGDVSCKFLADKIVVETLR